MLGDCPPLWDSGTVNSYAFIFFVFGQTIWNNHLFFREPIVLIVDLILAEVYYTGYSLKSIFLYER